MRILTKDETPIETTKKYTSYMINLLPLFERHSRSMPFRLSAILASSTKVSEILKFTSGDTSKKPIAFLSAYVSASAWSTCRLKAKCRRLPTKTFGIPGAC